jgi:hypothetical protein
MSSVVANSPKDGASIVLSENLHHLAVKNNPLSVRPSGEYCVHQLVLILSPCSQMAGNASIPRNQRSPESPP